MLLAYLKRQWKLLLLLAGAVAVFAAVFALYDLPVEAVAYACLLCLVLGLILFAVGYSAFLRRHRELEGLLGRALPTEGDLRDGAAALRRAGARNVLVSLGAGGALLLDETGEFRWAAAPAGTARGSVGAGDSMVAGFLAGWLAGGRWEDALRLAVAAGSATAFADGLARREEVEALLPAVRIEVG